MSLLDGYDLVWLALDENQQYAYVKTKTQISAIGFSSQIVQFLYFLNPKVQASSFLLCFNSLVCVGPGRNPNCWFSHSKARLLLVVLASFEVYQ